MLTTLKRQYTARGYDGEMKMDLNLDGYGVLPVTTDPLDNNDPIVLRRIIRTGMSSDYTGEGEENIFEHPDLRVIKGLLITVTD
jgi:hypothetical protein